MARLKFSKRIKNPFRKQSTGSSSSRGDDHGDDSSNGSRASTTSSLASDIRTHGPIDVDSCRKHDKIEGATFKRRDGSSSGFRRKNKKNILSNKREGGSPLAQIIESNSNHSSRASSPADNEDIGSSNNSRALTPSSRSSPQPQQRASVKPVAVQEALDGSPGAQTVSTVNGQDVFERSRSAVSVVSTAAASLWAPILPPEYTAESSPAADLSSSQQQPASNNFVQNSWFEITSRVPSISNRFRSGTPNSMSTANMIEGAEMALALSLSDSTKGKSAASNNINTNTANTPPGSSSGNRTKKSKELAKPSPTSVSDVFQPTTAYHVQLDPSMSISEESDKYSIIEEKYDRNAMNEESQQGPHLPTPRASNTSHHQTNAAQSSLVAPPEINRLSQATSNAFKTTGWDPLRYQSLEEAISAQSGMIMKPIGEQGIHHRRPRAGDSGSISSGTFNTKESKSSIASKEFLALKKDAEKNEFKMVIMQLKKQAAKMEPLEEIELKANDLDSMLNKKVQTPPRGKKVGGKQTPPVDPPGHDVIPARVEKPRDPPGVAGTLGTRSESPAPPSPNPFVEDVRGAGSPSDSSIHTSPGSSVQPDDANNKNASPNLVVDVIQSFSFDNDLGVENSLSDDSCSYYSEIESIGEITICETTTKLLDAHKSYVEDAKTNMSHPARVKSGSIMRVGSQFKKDKSKKVLSPRSARFGEMPSDKVVLTEQRGKKLTWYDDEENWNKPFTLRTDESFDASTVSSIGKVGLNVTGGVNAGVRYNTVIDQFVGDFIKGIGKYAACGSGNEDDVASFDVTEQQEI